MRLCLYNIHHWGEVSAYRHYNYRISLLIVLTLKDDVGARSESSRNVTFDKWRHRSTQQLFIPGQEILSIDRCCLGVVFLLFCMFFFSCWGKKPPGDLRPTPFQKIFHITFGRFPCLPTRRPPNLLYRPTLLFRVRTCSLAGTYTTVHPFPNFSMLFFLNIQCGLEKITKKK